MINKQKSDRSTRTEMTSMKRILPPLTKWLRVIFIIALFVFLGFSLLENVKELHKFKDQFSLVLFLISTGVVSIYLYLQSIIWKLVLRDLGCDSRQKGVSQLFFFSQLGKYIPGNVWVVLMRIERASKLGIGKGPMFTAAIIEHLYSIVAGIILFLVGRGDLYAYLMAVLLGLLLTVSPGFFVSGVNKILRLTGKNLINVRITHKRSFLYLTFFLFTWTVFAFGVWVAANSFDLLPLNMIILLGGYYALSFVIGFLTPFSPGGLGVREGAFVVLAGPVIGNSFAAVLAISVRVSFTLSELICIGLSRLPFFNRASPQERRQTPV